MELSHATSIKNLVKTKIIRNPIIGVSRIKWFDPLKAIRFPIAPSTASIAARMIGNIKTQMNASRIIRNFLSEALVFDTMSKTAM